MIKRCGSCKDFGKGCSKAFDCSAVACLDYSEYMTITAREIISAEIGKLVLDVSVKTLNRKV